MPEPSKRQALKKTLKLLKFLLTVNDAEIIKSSIESIIEMLEDEENTRQV